MFNRAETNNFKRRVERGAVRHHLVGCLALLAAVTGAAQPLPSRLGDLDADGEPTVLDLVRLVNYLNGRPSVPGALESSPAAFRAFADVNQDGFLNQADVDALADTILGALPPAELPQTVIRETSPAHGERGVAVTRETVFRFNHPLATNTFLGPSHLYATFGGRRLLSRCEVSSDRRTVTLFYLENLPGSARVRVTFNAVGLQDFLGRFVDLDGDSQSGGVATVDFDTLSLTPLAGTAVRGTVFASEQIQGTNATDFINRPLAGVTITVDGMEETLRAVTDANGNFILHPCPPGDFFVHIDGRTVTNLAAGIRYPDLSYYPFVGKAWIGTAGRTNAAGLMPGSTNAASSNGWVFLPLIRQGTLQPVSMTNDTMITFPASVIASNPALAGVSLMVPANSLFSDNGTRGGRVGIAPVPPDRLPGPLPPGLNFPLVITVQTDGGANFDRPVPACFPNLPDPATGRSLPPGSRDYLYSFDHDKGVWEAIGLMTVTADGMMVCTDAGVGILQPGWHGVGPPPLNPPPPPPPCTDACCEQLTSSELIEGIVNPGGSGDRCEPPPPCHPAPPPNRDCTHCYSSFQECENRVFEIFVENDNCSVFGDLDIRKDPCEQMDAVNYWIAIALCNKNLQNCLKTCIPPPDCPRNFASKGPSLFRNENSIAEAIDMLIGQTYQLVAPYLSTNGIPPTNVLAEIVQVRAQANQIAGGDALAFLRATARFLEESRVPREDGSGEVLGNAPAYSIRYLAEIERSDGTLEIRGMTRPRGQYSIFLPRDGKLRLISFYDHRTKAYGFAMPNLRPSAPFPVPRFFLSRVDAAFVDLDKDGLPDVVERIYGADPRNRDSDNDGISDGAEVAQGTDPLDGRPVATGIIATADTPGTAVDVCAVNDTAIVADSAAGVVIFNAVNAQNPIRVAQVDTPGNAQRVACSGNLVAVADGPAGVAIIDISDPPAARIVHQVSLGGSVQAMTAGGGIAYAGTASGHVAAIDLASGTILNRLPVSGAVEDLVLAGDHLFALTSSTLYSIDGLDGALRVAGSVASPIVSTPNRRLSVGGGIAYAVHGKGCNTFSITNPAQPTLIASGNTAQFGWKQIVPNGSGLGIGAVDPNFALDGPNDIWLYDLSDPRRTDQFLIAIPTPGIAYAASIFNGLAYVADGGAGLQVINYRAYDALGQSPTIALTGNFTLAGTNGFAEEGKAIRVTAQVTDDVQVRNVEFYVDGVRVLTDGNFPFEHRFTTPVISPSKTNFTLRAKATDTGGNFTFTDEILVTLTPDATPPRVVRTFPASGAIVGSLETLVAYFNEPINAATLDSSTFRLTLAGADGAIGTADDLALSGATSYRDELNAGFLTLASNLPPGGFEAIISSPLADLAGNQIARTFTWRFWVLGEQDTDQDGIPDSVEAAFGYNPNNPDSNGNGVLDGDEDTDGDGLRNRRELRLGDNAFLADSDNNGISDALEDPDFDGVNNLAEQARATDALSSDTDGDGWDDATEIADGTNPLDRSNGPNIRANVAAAVSYLNALAETPPVNAAWFVSSVPASYLNARPEAPPTTANWFLSSAAVSYLNALADTPPTNAVWFASSSPVSYLNALPEQPPTNAAWSLFSPTVSYSNAAPAQLNSIHPK